MGARQICEMPLQAAFADGPTAPVDDAGLGKLAVFARVRDYRARVKCAILAWHTLRAAVGDRHDVVSTE